MYKQETIDQLKQKFSGVETVAPKEKFTRDPDVIAMVPVEKFKEVCQTLKNDEAFAFDLPIQMTAVDYDKENQFELIYYLYSSKHKNGIVLKSRIDRDKPEIDSVTEIWNGMDFQEREVFDLMGITFKGHPNLKRIMMWDGFPGHPLRKDYVHTTDKYDSGLEVGTPGLDAKGVPIEQKN